MNESVDAKNPRNAPNALANPPMIIPTIAFVSTLRTLCLLPYGRR